jgi:DNA-binding MarR family transcriptional regulator
MQIADKRQVTEESAPPPFVPEPRFETDEKGYLYDAGFRQVLAGKGITGAAELLKAEAIRSMVLAGKVAYASFEETLTGLGITHPQYRALVCIDMAGADGTQLHPIAGFLGVTPRNVTGLVDALEAQGLVERVDDPNDRRAVIARLTSEGKAKAKQARAIHGAATERVMGILTTEEMLQLRHLSLKVLRAAEEVVAEGRKANG